MVDNSTAPIRVARVIARLNVGGPAVQAINLSARLERRGYHTLLIHGRLGPGEGSMDYLVPPNPAFEICYLSSLRRDIHPAADVAAFGRVLELFNRFKPAIVHTHTAKAGAVGRAAAVAYNATVGRRTPARLVHTYHGHVLDRYFSAPTARAFSTVERMLGRRSDALVTVSPLVRQDLLDTHHIGKPGQLRVVPLGLDLAPLATLGPDERKAARASFALDDDAHVVSLVGRLTAIKQPELFLEAAARLTRLDPRARFLIAGGGDLEAGLHARAADLGLTDRVRFLGWQRDVASIYAATDVLALTSRNEGTPVALIEAMAAGVPGVSFAVGGVPDVVSGPELGILIPEGDVEGLVAALGRVLADDATRQAMGSCARTHVRERFGIDRLVNDIDGLYRELLGQR